MSNNKDNGQESNSKTEIETEPVETNTEYEASSKSQIKTKSGDAENERGYKWWLRDVLVPLFGGGGLVAIIVALITTRPTPAAAQPVQLVTTEGKTETEQVALVSDTHLITEQDLGRLDHNVFHVDEDLEIAVHRPTSDYWEINTYDTLPTITLTDVPMMGLGVEMLRILSLEQEPPTIFGIRQREGYEVLLHENSTIASTPMNLNLYENPEFLRATLNAQQKTMSQLLGDDPFVELYLEMMLQEEMLHEMQLMLTEAFEQFLADQLPVQKRVHSGVYVIPLSKERLAKNLLIEILPESTLLDNAMNFVSFSGQFSPGSLHNLIVDQEHGIASFNASVHLGSVEIDGRKTDAILNNIGFIVAGNERALFVNLIYLSVDDISVYESLQDFLDSLRFTG